MKVSLNDWTVTGSHAGFWEFGRSMELNSELKGFMPAIPAEVPGSIHWDLHKAGYLQDPYWDTQSLACEWVNQRDWVYRSEIAASKQWEGRKIRLVCEGIDYSAKIRLNGEPIHEHKGMFTPAIVDISSLLQLGETNTLLIGINASPDGMGQLGHTNKVKNLKSRFGYKWDFCPRLPNIGLWKPVHLWITGHSWINDVFVQCDFDDHDLTKATAITEILLESDRGGVIQVSVDITGPQGKTCASVIKEVTARPGLQKVSMRFPIKQPQLWWPNGYGEQPLYQLTVKVWEEENHSFKEPSDQRNLFFGIRKLEFKQNEKAPADSLAYTVRVNDRDVYLKGWNWVPADQLYGRDLDEKYERLIGLAKSANVNLLRVWGGGLIEKEKFYDLCDQAGITVWQEMIQSSSGFNNEPNADADFLHELQSTMREVIREKRNHPSLIIWCGGNELTEGGHLQDRLVPLTDRHPTLRMLRDLAADLDASRLFLPTSSSGPEFFLDSKQGGEKDFHDVHGPWKYGGVEAHYALYNKSNALLHSEYGCDGFASLTSLRKFLPLEMLSPAQAHSMSWLHHGYEYWTLEAQISSYFGKVDDLQKQVWLGQWMQAEGIRYAVESNRRRAPVCSGSILWQMNEPFPNISCTSAVDYYGDPKLAYSWVALANRNVHVSMQYDKLAYEPGENFIGSVFLTADEALPRTLTACYQIRDEAGIVLAEEHFTMESENTPTQFIHQIDWNVPVEGNAFFVAMEVSDRAGKGTIASNEYVFVVKKPGADSVLSSLLEVPEVEVAIEEIELSETRSILRLKNVGDFVALWVRVEGIESGSGNDRVMRPLRDGLLVFPSQIREVEITKGNFPISWIAKGLNIKQASGFNGRHSSQEERGRPC